MRYIPLSVTTEDRERIEKRRAGDEKLKDGLFGQVELMRRLLEISPNCKWMTDLTQLLRINRKLEKIESEVSPVLELPEDEWGWVKKILDHSEYSKYGPQFVKIFGELLEAIIEAKTERPDGMSGIKLVDKIATIGGSNA
jgi:hypothetical protein